MESQCCLESMHASGNTVNNRFNAGPFAASALGNSSGLVQIVASTTVAHLWGGIHRLLDLHRDRAAIPAVLAAGSAEMLWPVNPASRSTQHAALSLY